MPRLQKRLGDVGVVFRRHGDGDGGDLREKVAQVTEGLATELLGDFGCRLVMSVIDPNKLDLRHLGVDAGMQTSHPAAPDNADRHPFFQVLFICLEIHPRDCEIAPRELQGADLSRKIYPDVALCSAKLC